MTLRELEKYFNDFLHLENFTADISLNGVQIQNSAPESKQITKVAFAVDACEESAKKAAEWGAQLLFVHHGIFWGHPETITGALYKKVSVFLQNDMALYGCHAPLDANNPYGNNFGLAARLNLRDVEKFGQWRGMYFGVKGRLESPLTIQELAEKVLAKGETPMHILPFGKKSISTVGIVSGGGDDNIDEALRAGLDAFITGEIGHSSYHFVKESCINVIAGGHYQTETIGVQQVMKKLAKETGIQTTFIDIPTNL